MRLCLCLVLLMFIEWISMKFGVCWWCRFFVLVNRCEFG